MAATMLFSTNTPRQGEVLCLAIQSDGQVKETKWRFDAIPFAADRAALAGQVIKEQTAASANVDTKCLVPGLYKLAATVTYSGGAIGAAMPPGTEEVRGEFTVDAAPAGIEGIRQVVERFAEGGLRIRKERSPSADEGLWISIRQCLKGRSFDAYEQFINDVLCAEPARPSDYGTDALVREAHDARVKRRTDALAEMVDGRPAYRNSPVHRLYRHGVHGFQLVKAATEVFLLLFACCSGTSICRRLFNAGEEAGRLGRDVTADAARQGLRDYLRATASGPTLPYLDTILGRLGLRNARPDRFPFCSDSARIQPCMFELIWSYYYEEGMLVQGLNAIALRFQNREVPTATGGRALATLTLDPLRPLSNLLWGYVQDQYNQLTVRRRAYEYEHQYGLPLFGKAVGELRPADRRSKFLEAFNGLLNKVARYYQDDANRMVEPDPFPLLGAIQEVHALLAEGADNQFGDLPSTARAEMLIQQWLLAQPPMAQFLQSRPMVPFAEPWMPQLDALKQLMGWTDVSIAHFGNLANYGEALLLSLRYGNWSKAGANEAENWVNYFRPEIQGYIHAYQTVTGVDLSVRKAAQQIDTTAPAIHLRRRMAQQLGSSGGDGALALPGDNSSGAAAAAPRLGAAALTT